MSEDLFGNEVEDKNNDRRGNKPKMKKEGAEKSGLVGMPWGNLGYQANSASKSESIAVAGSVLMPGLDQAARV